MTYGRETRDTKKAVRERVNTAFFENHFCTYISAAILTVKFFVCRLKINQMMELKIGRLVLNLAWSQTLLVPLLIIKVERGHQ